MTRTRDERVAGAFRPDERMERLAALRKADPAAFAKQSPERKMALGYYVAAKQAAERRGADRG